MPRSSYQERRRSIQVAYQRWRLVGRHEELHLHLLELAGAEDEVRRGDLVAKRLADLGDPERRLHARELQDVLEVDEDALRRLGPQVHGRRASSSTGPICVLNIRWNWRGSVRSQSGPSPGRFDGFSPAAAVLELVGAKAHLAGAAVDQRVAEARQVSRCLPDLRVLDDGRVEGDDPLRRAQHRPPPLVLDVLLEQDAVVAVVVGRGDAAVDLRGLEDEPAPLAQRDDLVEGDVGGWGLRGGGHRGGG